MFQELVLFAQDSKPTTGTGPWEFPLLMLALFFLFYVFVLRPMSRRQEQDRVAMLSNLSKNDKVLTTAGIYGTVVAVSDKEDEVTVKVDDNVRLRMTKASIHRNLTREEAAKAQKNKAPAPASTAIQKDKPS
jgi:preprotein translocase subunit YajC